MFPFLRFCRSVVSAVACSSPSIDAVRGIVCAGFCSSVFLSPCRWFSEWGQENGRTGDVWNGAGLYIVNTGLRKYILLEALQGMYSLEWGYTLSNLEAKQTMYKMASKSKSFRIGRFSRSPFSVGTFYVLYGSRKIHCLEWCIK